MLLDSCSPCSAVELLKSDYRSLGEPHAVRNRFVSYLLSNQQSLAVLKGLVHEAIGHHENDKRQSNDMNSSASLQVQVFSVLQFDPVLGHMLLRYPSTLLPLFEDAAVQAQEELFANSTTDRHLDVASCCRRFRIRLTHLPPNYCCKSTSASNVGRILQTSGTVVRATPTCMMEYSRTYACTKCNYETVAQVDLSTPALAIPQPSNKCPECGKANSLEKKLLNGSTHADYQQVKIQESKSKSDDQSAIPRSILLQLTHDLVDTCKPGDEIVVVGTLQAQWPAPSSHLVAQVDYHITTSLLVHSIRVMHKQDLYSEWMTPADDSSTATAPNNNSTNSNPRDKYPQEFEEYWNTATKPMEARNFIVGAMCPKLYGLFTVKLGLLLTLIGGSSLSSIQQQQQHGESSHDGGSRARKRPKHKENGPEQFSLGGQRQSVSQDQQSETTGWSTTTTTSTKRTAHESIQTKRRAQSHILLVGEAGQGKSQLLKFAAALSPRSVLTTGTGCSSAGLTAAAVRDPSKTGGGSEFTLEAGALVLADMGVCCIDEFGCIRQEDRTTIHEAMEQQTISVAKAGIVCKLNARATIVAVMNPCGGHGRSSVGKYDFQQSLAANTNLASPLLSRFDLIFLLLDAATAERDDKIASFLLNHAIQPDGATTSTSGNADSTSTSQHWSLDKLRAYTAIVRSKFHPTLTPEAASVLQRYYQAVRNTQSSCQLPITVRFLESLIRLSQAHARLMYRNTVTEVDAVAVVGVMEQSCASTTSQHPQFLTEDAPDDADTEFQRQKAEVLAKYGTGTQVQSFGASSQNNTSAPPPTIGQTQSTSGWDQYKPNHNGYGHSNTTTPHSTMNPWD